MGWLDRVPWTILIIGTILLGGAPFVPEPHLVEKMRMLSAGDLVRPLDIFDLFYHAAPVILLAGKCIRTLMSRGSRNS